jgi:ATP-dependent Clp protease adaptor protein ClpS
MNGTHAPTGILAGGAGSGSTTARPERRGASQAGVTGNIIDPTHTARPTDARARSARRRKGQVDRTAMSERKDQDQNPDGGSEGGTSTNVVVKTRTKTKKPSMYKVLMLNDDYTPMEFVVHVLESFFGKSREEATEIMLHVHHRGVGVCGVYSYEVAETKVTQVIDYARKHQHPLQCTLEKE